MSEEERMRRAEEILARRHNSRIPANNINSRKKRQMPLVGKISLQILVSICIFGICYFLTQNHSYAIDMIKPVISKDTDFQKLYSDINEVIKNITKEAKQNEEQKTIETAETPESKKEEAEELKKDDANGIGGGTDETQISETESDVEYIKKHASFVKPVTGIITSPYGPRTPTDIVSANHAGVDIGAALGTEIIASMAGTAEVVSTEGDYGKHIKITNGEISTLYAHCSELLVNEGDKIEQGKVIAKVGATGKATGPHLHFEIRRNNATVDPNLILDLE